MTETLVFIPARNEEENLPAVLGDLRTELPAVDVLVVDDGSTDRTADVRVVLTVVGTLLAARLLRRRR